VYILEVPRQCAGEEKLSAGERAVVALARQGLSNQEIAKARGTSPRTVANQLASAYRKLGIDGRAGLR
jgi:DNA-binding CsgD family transcriptional regulator